MTNHKTTNHTGGNDVGRGPEDGGHSKSLPTRGTDTNGRREEAVGRLPRVREQPEQDHSTSRISILYALYAMTPTGQEVYLGSIRIAYASPYRPQCIARALGNPISANTHR